MKAPTYILKRVYLERNQERELLNHEKRLSQITTSKEHTINQVKKKTQQVLHQQELIKKNHERAIQFRNIEKQREQIASDKVLLKKLLQMSVTSSSQTQLPSSTMRSQHYQQHDQYGQANNSTPHHYTSNSNAQTRQSQPTSLQQLHKEKTNQQNQDNSLSNGQQKQNSTEANNQQTIQLNNSEVIDQSSPSGNQGDYEQQNESGNQKTQNGGPGLGHSQSGQINYQQKTGQNPSSLQQSALVNQSTLSKLNGKNDSNKKDGFRQNQSSVGLHSVGRKREEERINMENLNLANRMVKLPPVISNKKLENEYQKNKELGKKIQRFHHLKKKIEKEYQRKEKTDLDEDENADGLDVNDKELMDQKVQLVLWFKNISFINFLPRNIESEKYYMEVKASVKASRTTTPELYDDFAKATVNEFFYLHELRKSKLMQIGIYQQKDGKDNFLGDFEVDLTPYYLEGVQKAASMDLRNFKELNKRPSYMTTDMRKKGGIEFDLKVTSNIKEYLLDKSKVNKQDAPTMDNENKKDWTDVQSNQMH